MISRVWIKNPDCHKVNAEYGVEICEENIETLDIYPSQTSRTVGATLERRVIRQQMKSVAQ